MNMGVIQEYYAYVGNVGSILILLGVFVLSILMLKSGQFLRCRIWRSDELHLVQSMLEEKQFKQAIGKLKQHRGPITEVLAAAIEVKHVRGCSQQEVEAEIKRLGQLRLHDLQRYLRPLEVVAHLAPLIGLLGTVMGIIMAFAAIKSASVVDPGQLSKGISHALITTALGLGVAIPAQLAFHYLDSIVDRVRLSMSDQVTRLMHSALLHSVVNKPQASNASVSDSLKLTEQM
ncbi:MAG: MotA/TolQ/ExbB proton channel family protein [Francisellaceae bacterium]